MALFDSDCGIHGVSNLFVAGSSCARRAAILCFLRSDLDPAHDVCYPNPRHGEASVRRCLKGNHNPSMVGLPGCTPAFVLDIFRAVACTTYQDRVRFPTLEALMTYMHDQGLIAQKLPIEDLFLRV